MKYFIFVIFLFLVSCDPGDLKTEFSNYACGVYVDCEFSKVEGSFCLEFADFSFDQIPKNQEIDCFNCLKSIGCKMWVDSSECSDCF